MYQPMAQAYQFLIVGLGITGLSVARFLHQRGISFAIADNSKHPSQHQALLEFAPEAQVYTGDIKAAYLEQAEQVVVSPGVSLRSLEAVQANMKKDKFIGDIELFARYVPQCPIAAITGTNGKSTVASLLSDAAMHAGLHVASGGNLAGEHPHSMPALDLIEQHKDAELYILELSSFQLETIYSLQPSVSVILNIKPDHLDRYESFAAYRDAKLRIHRNSAVVVVNREEDVALQINESAIQLSFGLDQAPVGHFGVVESEGVRHIAFGDELLISESDITLEGDVGLLNTQAMFAMGHSLGLPFDAMCNAARDFHSLAHRLQYLGNRNGVDWYDDSKATNVSATCAALNAIAKPIILIAGGLGKGEDFEPLADLAESRVPRVRAAMLLGKDAKQIATAIEGRIPYTQVENMEQAVFHAAATARPGDCVLLSPACASLDMYSNYKARGQAFRSAYKKLS